MILILSGVILLVGLFLLVYGFGKDNIDYKFYGSGLILAALIVGFFFVGLFVEVDTKISYPRIEKIINNSSGVYYWIGNGGVATSDVEVVKNPNNYIIRKTVKINSYGFATNYPAEYTIEKIRF